MATEVCNFEIQEKNAWMKKPIFEEVSKWKTPENVELVLFQM